LVFNILIVASNPKTRSFAEMLGGDGLMKKEGFLSSEGDFEECKDNRIESEKNSEDDLDSDDKSKKRRSALIQNEIQESSSSNEEENLLEELDMQCIEEPHLKTNAQRKENSFIESITVLQQMKERKRQLHSAQLTKKSELLKNKVII
jgi:hypothetical protein